MFDPGIFSIGDTVCDKSMKVKFKGIPTFAPEHFAVVEQIDSMKRKQFAKGMEQIAEEGAIQIFFYPGSGMERVVVGVVGMLQFDVLEYRMKDEYGIGFRKTLLPHQHIRRVVNDNISVPSLTLATDTIHVQDFKGNDLLVFPSEWSIKWALDKNPDLELAEFNE